MREKWELWKDEMKEVTTMTKREFLLTAAVCLLGGIVLGFLFSPRKETTIGSFNGNNNNGEFGTADEDEKRNLKVAKEEGRETIEENESAE